MYSLIITIMLIKNKNYKEKQLECGENACLNIELSLRRSDVILMIIFLWCHVREISLFNYVIVNMGMSLNIKTTRRVDFKN